MTVLVLYGPSTHHVALMGIRILSFRCMHTTVVVRRQSCPARGNETMKLLSLDLIKRGNTQYVRHIPNMIFEYT